MAVIDISTHDGLLTAAADWINRGDLVDRIPSFVRLAEAGFNRELRVRDMMVRARATSNLEFVPVPTDFLQEYTLTFDPVGRAAQNELRYVGKNTADRLKAGQLAGPPGFYTLIDGAFELIPAPTTDQPMVMVYYARIPRLGELTGDPALPRQTNWLLDRSPDLYLASTILQAAPYLNDVQRLQTWAALRAEIIGNLTLENERGMRSSTQLTARAASF